MRLGSVVRRGGHAGLGVLAVFAVVVWTGPALGPMGQLSSVAYAAGASTLTADQAAAISSAVQTALANIDPSLTGAARDAAVKAALEKLTKDSIALYGEAAVSAIAHDAIADGVSAPLVIAAVLPAAVGTGISVADAIADATLGAVAGGAAPTVVAEAVIATAALQQYANNDVGTGLGKAAAQLASTNPTGANQIGQVVANEAPRGAGTSFSVAVLDNGGSQQLADAGNQFPTAVGEVPSNQGQQGNNDNRGGVNQLGTSRDVLPPCQGPSCS